MSSRQNGQAGEGDQQQGGLRPRYRRAFGCVTWVYMGMLTFLTVNFFLSLPFRYVGGGEIYNYVPPRLAYLGTLLLVPGMVFAAVLGARTYRAPGRVAGRVGIGVGALIGWSGFFSLAWLSTALGLAERDQAFRIEPFADIGGIAFYLFPPLTVAATVLVVIALYSREADAATRRRFGLIGAGLAILAGLGLLVSDFDLVGLAGILIATVSAALAGWVGGVGGYARAGGDDLIPPGATIRRREPRREAR